MFWVVKTESLKSAQTQTDENLTPPTDTNSCIWDFWERGLQGELVGSIFDSWLFPMFEWLTLFTSNFVSQTKQPSAELFLLGDGHKG